MYFYVWEETFIFCQSDESSCLNICTLNWIMKCCNWNSLDLRNFVRVFFISNTFTSNARSKSAKNQANAKQHLQAEHCCLKIIHILHPHYHPKIIGHVLKIKLKNKCACIHEIILLILMKMKLKIKKCLRRYNINRARSRHGRKYGKYKKCLSMMMFICIKQHLSNIWSSTH